jgi:putative tryptophan/tyrosine transport system substrate-binding protein
MRRRDFIAGIAVSTAMPLAVRAQQGNGKQRVSILLPFAEADADAEIQTWMAAFLQALRELGWIDGSNVLIDTHWTTADVGRSNQAAVEVIDRKPHVILANGPLAVASLKPITSTIPIVFTGVADPVGSGFVASLARPGGNITGFTLGEFTMSGKKPEILKKIAPHVTRVTVIYNPQQVPQVGRLAAVQTAAATLGLQVSAASVTTAEEIKHAIEKLEGERDRGVIVLPAPVTITNRSLIIALLARYRLPAVYEFPVFARDGGLVSYGSDRVVQFRQAAAYVDRILRGANPADLPIQDPTKFELIVNLKTAKALGLTVPESLLATADEVIE